MGNGERFVYEPVGHDFREHFNRTIGRWLCNDIVDTQSDSVRKFGLRLPSRTPTSPPEDHSGEAEMMTVKWC